MRISLMAPVCAVLLAACNLSPPSMNDPDVPAPETRFAASAEPQATPSLAWTSTGKGLWIYHNVWGDCAFLEHGHGRNSVWGLWRMPLGAVIAGAPEAAEDGGYAVRFTCADGSACIEAGASLSTPDRTDAHSIPFETLEKAERYLAAAASLDKACKALK